MSKVWTAPRDLEWVTCVWWSQIDNEFYFATWYHDPNSGDDIVSVYRFNRGTNIATMIVDYTRVGGVTAPIADVCESGSYDYLHTGYLYDFCEVLRLDPVLATLSVVFESSKPAESNFGGIAVDAGGIIVDFNGWEAYRSPSGDVGSWVLDADLYAAFAIYNSYSLVTHKGDSNYIYLGALTEELTPTEDDVVYKRTGAGTWVMDLNHPDPLDPVTSTLSFGIEHIAGAVQAIYAQFKREQGIDNASIYRKPVGGIWTLDWDGLVGTGWWGVACQGVAQFAGDIYGLWMLPSDSHDCRLYKRIGVNDWQLVQEFLKYDGLGLFGMAVAPNTLFKCHEV